MLNTLTLFHQAHIHAQKLKSSNVYLVRAGSTGAWFGFTCSLVHSQTIGLESAATVWTRDQRRLGRLPCSLIHLLSMQENNNLKLAGYPVNKRFTQQLQMKITISILTYWAKLHNQRLRVAK